ncbi:hypothetical protein LshimejAT787_1901360 [Lyophyllum shimeji]|uniref:Uncharacterized protein n=1 Tax=Lyophyllum shimeji TaxID=47721 RepID=A0A9P3PZW9_LYOSH|nr:hypothetical protein LshimejAT787_1901360 [Lyophyllum shimeji]
MEPFPFPLFPLICASLCVTTLSLIFATLIISVSPILWIFPATFISTIAYHAATLLISNVEDAGSLRLYSFANLLASCSITCIWAAVSGITTALTVLLATGRLKDATTPRRLWPMVVSSVCALIECIVMGSIAIRTREERKRILYAAKWKWRPGHNTAAATQWSIGARSAG